jgi:peptidoglycan/LPS O-acetylase OafA/YrhL
MSRMRKDTQLKLIIWLKRVLGATAFLVWISILYTIMQSTAPLSEQVPYCMGGTMLTFGILTVLFKGLDYWQTQIKD